VVEILKALADENRLRILNMLLFGELCVCELGYVLDMTQTNVSRHLKILWSAGVVERTKRAQWMYYHIRAEFEEAYPDLLHFIKANAESLPGYERDILNYRAYKDGGIGCARLK